MFIFLAVLSIFPLVPNPLYPATVSAGGASFAGVWKGDSVCQIKDSPCHDETSVYYVSKSAQPDSFQMRMNKIVGGNEETMGTVNCQAAANAGWYICRLNDLATWTWRLGKNVLDGELQYRGRLYRKIHLIRAD